jgi:Ni/Co efflux regulator RcnB
MKHLATLASAALALSLASTAAMAAGSAANFNHNQHQNGGMSDGGRRDAGPRNQGPHNAGPQNHGPQNFGPQNRGPQNKGPQNHGPQNKGPTKGSGQQWHGDNGANHNWRNGNNNAWNNNWRPPAQHTTNNAQYRRNFKSPQRFRVQRYRAPVGYHYRRWSFGERLPFGYFASQYWLTNFLSYGLFPPPPGYVWVRYGDDALLVDRYTGEIVQVRYDVFYW